MVSNVNTKQFATIKEDDNAFTFQRNLNRFGCYLMVTELKGGGRRRNVIISKGQKKSA